VARFQRVGTGSSGTFRFGDFELDPAAYELRRAGVRVRLPRQPLRMRHVIRIMPGNPIATREV